MRSIPAAVRRPEAVLVVVCLLAGVVLGLGPAPPTGTSRLGNLVFFVLLSAWWALPIAGVAAGARLLGLRAAAAVVLQLIVLLVEVGLVVEVMFFEPPDGQSALIVLPAPVIGAVAGITVLAVLAVVRWLRRAVSAS